MGENGFIFFKIRICSYGTFPSLKQVRRKLLLGLK